MKMSHLIIVATLLCAVVIPGIAEKAKPEPTTKPATKVAAMVGKVAITNEKVDRILQQMPNPSRPKAIEHLITQQLLEAYAKTLPCTPKDVEIWKAKMTEELKKRNMGTLEKFMADRKIGQDDLMRMVRFENLEKLAVKTASSEAADAIVKEKPSYFNGTELQASHILLMCGPGSSDAKRAETTKKLKQIIADIKSGKVKFAEAAAEHSTCSSAKKGGDLGSFTFEKMVPPFSQTAFALKVGDVSGIVETQFGFHIITVTKRTEGTAKPGPNAPQIAKQIILENFRVKIMAEARKNNPVTIMK
ncbi:MAG: hypothetical protein GY794_07800 [bacterium]|nr:hypothetical protein [bacterium]